MPPKRKRSDRASDAGRPSPHRPGDTMLGQHDREEGGGRARGRGGQRGGYNNRRDSSSHNHRSSHPSSHNGSPVMTRSNLPAPKSPSAGRSHAAAQSMPPPNSPPPTSSLPQSNSRPSTATDSTSKATAPQSLPTIEYRYDNLTDEKLRQWAERGRKEIITHGCQSREDVDITELSSLFQEFIHSVLSRRMDPTDAGNCVKEILGDGSADAPVDPEAFAPQLLFLDSLAIIMEMGSNAYHPSLIDFLKATAISPALMRQVLDNPLLGQLGLVRDIFQRSNIRHATNLLYRQANFNLLREESEGYSKLITELYTTSDVLPPDMAAQTFERIKGLIGTFDLDVGRVLDVTLDVAAAVLVKQFRFFVKLLRVSSWWPRGGPKSQEPAFLGGLPTWAAPGYPDWTTTEADEARNAELKLARDVSFWDRAREAHLAAFFELGGRQPTASSERNLALTNGASGQQATLDSQREWLEATKTVAPNGNHVAAQLLGFKLLFYYSDSRDSSDVLPANLLYLAALLIKIGFISLPDLWPHLSPADDKMENVRDKKLKELEDEERKHRGGGQLNALAMAAALPQDEDGPAPAMLNRREVKKPEAESKAETPKVPEAKVDEPHEQKVSLLIQLLTIGAIPEALFILGRFPWITEAFPEVLDGLHRILHVSLDKVYNESCPTKTMSTDCPTKHIPDPDQNKVPKGDVRLTRLTTKKILRWPTPDKNDHNETQDYRYYWDEWTDNVPVCQTVDDIFTLCDTLLNVSGVNIGKDEALLSKLATIGSMSLHKDSSDANLNRWQGLLRRLLLPALSHTKANASAVNAVWNLLSRYPMTTRFSLYSEWFEGQISRLPAMKKVFARAQSETNATMKRVSKTNTSEMARRLAKSSCSSPGIVFRVAFEQLESYDNLISAFVECAKYFTSLSYDVLIWSLMNSLGKSRSRTQADHALTTSKWLSALSNFAGTVFNRYSLLNPTPVLQYVNHQLLEGNSTDLIILTKMIRSMGGVIDTSDFSEYQVLSMAGGEALRRHTLIRATVIDRNSDSPHKSTRSALRLAKALTDSKLAGALLINLAQFRQAAIFNVPEDEAHIKFLSTLIDDTHQILIQYLDFLWSNLDGPSYDAAVPSIPQLLKEFGLDSGLAFLIGRASLSSRMLPWKSKEASSSKEKPAALPSTEVDKEGDINMSESNATSQQVTPAADDSARTPQKPTQNNAAESTPPAKPADPSQIQVTLQPIVDAAQETMPPEVWQKITPDLYATFWALQLGDIFCPEKIYKAETARLRAEETAVSKDRADMSRKGQERKMEKRKELMQLQIDLSEECREHMLRQGRWKFTLSKQFQTSFPEPRASAENIADVLLEQCFLPRLLLSSMDAEYTYRFIKALHDWNAPGFKLMAFCERLFNANRLRSLIFTCTVREASYFGRFLKLILEDLSRWHKNDPVPGDKDKQRLGAYDKEGKGQGDQARLGFSLTVDENGKPQTFVEHAQFQDLLFRWHKNLNIALKSCLAGTEWMHIRNAMSVLLCVLDFFPAIDFMATQFSAQLQKIAKQEAASKTMVEGEAGHRVDLSVAAQGLLSGLQKRKAKWMMVQAFRPNSVGGAPAEGDKASLRPTAPDFKPQATSAAPKQSSAEAEDGEVQDGKPKTRTTSSNHNDSGSNDALPPRPSVNSTSIKEAPRRDVTPNAPSSSRASGAKADSRGNTLPDRPPPSLPSRPDVPIPGHYSERYGQSRNHDRRETRDGREPRNPRDSRDSREARDSRDSRDAKEPHDPRNNWPKDKEFHERGRDSNDRRTHDDREAGRAEQAPRHPHQDRDRSQRESRGSSRAQESTNEPASQPKADTPSAPTEPAMNPERAALFRQDTQDWPGRRNETDQSSRGRKPPPASDTTSASINPERAALIGDKADNTPARGPRDEGRERGPRNHSPRRGPRHGHEQAAHPPVEPSHDDRKGRPYPPQEPRASGRDPRDRSPLPGNFRGERPMDRPGERGGNDKNREASGFHRPNSRGQEHDYRAASGYEDMTYGRLNTIEPVTDAPSGPRGRGGRHPTRGGHGGPGAVPPPPARYPHDTPERHPPTGPSSSSGRANRRSGYESHGGPQTPSGGPLHNDRMRNLGSNQEAPPPAAGVHPDRLAQMGPNHPPPPPPPPPGGPPPREQGRHSMGSTMTPDRGRYDQRSASSNTATPMSESGGGGGGVVGGGGGERTRGGSRRQLAGINNMLQANKPEPTRSSSSRGSRPRQMLANSDVQVLTGGSPPTPTQERPDPVRHESSHKGPANGEEAPARDEHERSRRDREPRSDRPSRSSRRASRDRERERSPGREKDNKEHRDYRDRRSGAGQEGGSNREERESRRSGRGASSKESAPHPGSGRDGAGGGRDRSHRGDGGSGNRGPQRDGGGGGGSRPDDRRESSGRKRRGEEGGGGNMGSEREKRPRR